MTTANTTPRKLPGSLQTNRSLATWLSINRDGTVDMRPGKIEIGQGILSALTQIVAEELDVNIERIRVVTADTAHSPNEGTTSGSRSIEESGMAFRYAAAEARELLLARAGVKLGVSLEQLSVSDGTITSRGGGSVTYWDITDASLLQREATAETAPKSHTQHKIVGGSAPRADIPRKVSGVPSYVQDMEMPGLLHGRVSRPPSPGAQLVSVELDEVRAMPGVVAVLRDGSYLGVVAEREEQAIRAQRRLARSAKWREVAKLPEFDPRFLLKLPAKTEVISEKNDAKVADIVTKGATLEAEYSRHFLAHAALAPSCAVAICNAGKYTVWSHSQGIYLLRDEMAPALGVALEDVVIHHMESAGCYGHNGADDVAFDAALLARAVPGRPVRVQWMRDEEFMWEPVSSAMVVKTGATLGKDGNIASWHFDVWSHGHTSRPGRGTGSNLLSSWYLEKPLQRAPTGNPPMPGGGSHRNAIPLYEFPNQCVTNHLIPDPPIRTSSLRGLGSQTNVFAIESFMDELALAANIDPIEFRLRHLKDARARAVIEKVAAMAGWKANQKGDGVRGRGIGVGCAARSPRARPLTPRRPGGVAPPSEGARRTPRSGAGRARGSHAAPSPGRPHPRALCGYSARSIQGQSDRLRWHDHRSGPRPGRAPACQRGPVLPACHEGRAGRRAPSPPSRAGRGHAGARRGPAGQGARRFGRRSRASPCAGRWGPALRRASRDAAIASVQGVPKLGRPRDPSGARRQAQRRPDLPPLVARGCVAPRASRRWSTRDLALAWTRQPTRA